MRFVVGPERVIVPDLAQNLPGRGLWVTPDYDSITTAIRKNLFAKAAKEQVKASPDLLDLIARLLRQRCLSFLGLARRAGLVVLGQPQVEAALKEGSLALLVLADDAGQSLYNRRDVPVCAIFTRDELGMIFGHEQIVYAGLARDAMTDKLKAEWERLTALTKAKADIEGNG